MLKNIDSDFICHMTKNLNGNTFSVYMYMCKNSDEEGKANCSQTEMMKDLCLSIGCIKRCLKKLLENKYLRKEDTWSGRTANTYYIL
jgi:CTP-dependent riboflavin kinase